MNRFAGRAAIVTGAAGGIGAAIVARLVSEGAIVAAIDRDSYGLSTLGPAHAVHGIPADLTSVDATLAAVQRAMAALGRPADVVVSAAGGLCARPGRPHQSRRLELQSGHQSAGAVFRRSGGHRGACRRSSGEAPPNGDRQYRLGGCLSLRHGGCRPFLQRQQGGPRRPDHAAWPPNGRRRACA